MAEYDFHFTAEVMDGIFGEVIEARGAWDSLNERLDNMESGGGTGDYTELTNKPTINNVELDGNKTSADLGLQPEIDSTHKVDADNVDDSSSTNKFATAAQISQITTNKAGIGAVANVGAKNLLDYTFSINGNTDARTSNGVTFTINADGSISTSGTASSNVTSAWIQKDYVVPNDPVILSGCPAGGADNTYRIDILDGVPTGSIVAFDYGNGAVIKSSMFTNGIGIIRIRIEKGQNVDGLVFRPMVRPASITDDTYVPYAPTNRELYEMILALQSGS
jgi:hypothetical protein